MGTPTNVSEAGLWVLWAVSDVLTKWAPAIVSTALDSVTGAPGSTASSTVQLGTITEPVTAMQVASYLHTLTTPDTYSELYNGWIVFVSAALIVSCIFLVVIVYNGLQLMSIRRAEHARFAKEASEAEKVKPATRTRWDHINDQLHAGTEHGWRIAILEADILLKELLDTLGLRGETVADQLRQVNRANFATIDMAWEAHRARNRIAHEIGGGGLTLNEARRVISLYAHVFKEFDFNG
jgi:uncharacterized membrane protein